MLSADMSIKIDIKSLVHPDFEIDNLEKLLVDFLLEKNYKHFWINDEEYEFVD